MKKKTLAIVAVVFLLGIIAALVCVGKKALTGTSLEALSGCEVIRGHATIWECEGNVGTCKVEKGSFTLTCTGREKQ